MQTRRGVAPHEASSSGSITDELKNPPVLRVVQLHHDNELYHDEVPQHVSAPRAAPCRAIPHFLIVPLVDRKEPFRDRDNALAVGR